MPAGRGVGRWSIVALAIAVLAPFGPGLRPAGAQGVPDAAVVTRARGVVEVQRQGRPPWTAVGVGARLVQGDELRGQAGASAELRLPDGSTLVLSENSRIVITRLKFDPKTHERESSYVHLVVGKVRAILATASLTLVRARQSNFAISTPAAVAAARGTDWVSYFHPGGIPDIPAPTMLLGVTSGEVVCLTLGNFVVGVLYSGDIFQVQGSGGCTRAVGVDRNALFGPANPGTEHHGAMDGPASSIDPSTLDGLLGPPFTRLGPTRNFLFTPETPRPISTSLSPAQ